jgi:hypothetical protein
MSEIKCRCWKPAEPQRDCPVPEHRARAVMNTYDSYTQPSGTALLADLHQVLDEPREIHDRELDELREQHWRDYGGEA